MPNQRRHIHLKSIASECDPIGAGSSVMYHYSEKSRYAFILDFNQLAKLKKQIDSAYEVALTRRTTDLQPYRPMWYL